MSYCRFSSDCYQSDVYVYEGWNGIAIHVAGARLYSNQPRPEPPDDMDPEKIIAYHAACREWAKAAELRIIGLPCDRQDFYESTPGEAAQKLIELRDMGYWVPEYAIEALQEEQTEMDNAEAADDPS